MLDQRNVVANPTLPIPGQSTSLTDSFFTHYTTLCMKRTNLWGYLLKGNDVEVSVRELRDVPYGGTL